MKNFRKIKDGKPQKITQNHVKIFLGDFNAQLDKWRKFRKTIRKFRAQK